MLVNFVGYYLEEFFFRGFFLLGGYYCLIVI